MELVEPIRDKEKIAAVKCILKKNSNRDYLLFTIGINSGLRISDLLRLKVNDVKNKNHIEIKEQKTGKYKKFPISNSYKKELKDYIEQKEDNTFLFSNNRSKNAITRIQAYRILNKACQSAGIESRIGTHTLRKTFGYHFYNQNKDIALLQSILNHSAPSITLRYIGINQELIDNSMQAFML